MEALKDDSSSHKQSLLAILPAVALELTGAVSIKFDDIDELKAHPMCAPFLVDFGSLIEGVAQTSKDQLMSDRVDVSAFSEA